MANVYILGTNFSEIPLNKKIKSFSANPDLVGAKLSEKTYLDQKYYIFEHKSKNMSFAFDLKGDIDIYFKTDVNISLDLIVSSRNIKNISIINDIYKSKVSTTLPHAIKVSNVDLNYICTQISKLMLCGNLCLKRAKINIHKEVESGGLLIPEINFYLSISKEYIEPKIIKFDILSTTNMPPYCTIFMINQKFQNIEEFELKVYNTVSLLLDSLIDYSNANRNESLIKMKVLAKNVYILSQSIIVFEKTYMDTPDEEHGNCDIDVDFILIHKTKLRINANNSIEAKNAVIFDSELELNDTKIKVGNSLGIYASRMLLYETNINANKHIIFKQAPLFKSKDIILDSVKINSDNLIYEVSNDTNIFHSEVDLISDKTILLKDFSQNDLSQIKHAYFKLEGNILRSNSSYSLKELYVSKDDLFTSYNIFSIANFYIDDMLDKLFSFKIKDHNILYQNITIPYKIVTKIENSQINGLNMNLLGSTNKLNARLSIIQSQIKNITLSINIGNDLNKELDIHYCDVEDSFIGFNYTRTQNALLLNSTIKNSKLFTNYISNSSIENLDNESFKDEYRYEQIN